VEEHRRLDASTKAVHLPIPDIGVGPRQLLWLWHLGNPLSTRLFRKSRERVSRKTVPSSRRR
jgi:hypothetical protein